jgi:hypothetical protein
MVHPDKVPKHGRTGCTVNAVALRGLKLIA